MLKIPADSVEHLSTSVALISESRIRGFGESVSVDPSNLSDDDLAAIVAHAEDVGQTSLKRQARALLGSRNGELTKVPNISVGASIILDYLKKDLLDGWLYREDVGGYAQPYLVTSVRYSPKTRDGDAYISIQLRSISPTALRDNASLSLGAHQVTNKNALEILAGVGLFKEDKELQDSYNESFTYFRDEVLPNFAKEFVVNGKDSRERQWEETIALEGSRCIQDLPVKEMKTNSYFWDSELQDAPLPVPHRLVTRVFNLKSNSFHWVHPSDMVRYEYKPELRDKLILPARNARMLDILTQDIEDLKADIVEGKTAGNVILSQGEPGVGKTLTAEIYSEIVGIPLYRVGTSDLGTTPASVEENLKTIFKRSARWGAALLLDEVDVYVARRGTDIQRNAIVSEFLRTLEYFDGLMFLTTNIGDAIDDAILSRCAAIIRYHPLEGDEARLLWKTLSENIDMSLSDELLDSLVKGFAKASGRDVKMLLRLVARYSRRHGREPQLQDFIDCSSFRNMEWRVPEYNS